MSNYHKKIISFHNKKVTLPQTEQEEMRQRRKTNRDRLKRNLDLKPLKFESQGSYKMHTMVQHPKKDYDIDDGIYFKKDDLKNESVANIKKTVRDASDDGSFNRPPEIRKKCIRVYYDEGYHVDIPIYREVTQNEQTHYELAGNDAWEESDPSQVTDWFCSENERQSPNMDNGGQLRRITRLLKAFARGRENWKDKIATGFMISKLVVDNYKPNNTRDDKALQDTMVSIRDALNESLEITHPKLDEKLTEGINDPKVKFFLEKLNYALNQLDICADESEAWDIIFNTDFFCGGDDDNNGPNEGGPNDAGPTETKSQPRSPVNKRGGGRYA